MKYLAVFSVAVCLLITTPLWGQVLFYDDFDAGIDEENWTVHGTGYVAGYQCEAIIWSNSLFHAGLESAIIDLSPYSPGDSFYVQGQYWTRSAPAITAGTGAVMVGLGWNGLDNQFYWLEFITVSGDTSVYRIRYHGCYDADIGAFSIDHIYHWKFSFTSLFQCEIYIDEGEGWELRHSEIGALGNMPVVICLTGAGGGWGRWNNIEMGIDTTPVRSRSWGSIKALYR